jgi:hypothetical protein
VDPLDLGKRRVGVLVGEPAMKGLEVLDVGGDRGGRAVLVQPQIGAIGGDPRLVVERRQVAAADVDDGVSLRSSLTAAGEGGGGFCAPSR